MRRTDSLGHIVIPKGIRRTLKIRKGDPSQVPTIDDLYIALHKIVDRYNKTQ